MPVIGRLMRCSGEGGPCTPYLPRQSVQNFRVKTHVSPGRQAWAIYESCRRLPGRLQVALPLIGLQRMWDPPRAVWLAAALLAGLCSIDTRGTRCFRVCHTHWTGPPTLLRPASLFSRIHLPSCTFNRINNPHRPHRRRRLDGPRPRFLSIRCWTSMITKRGLLRMHRFVGDLGLLPDKETNERWEGTAQPLADLWQLCP